MAALPALQLPNTRLPGPLRPAKSFTVLSTTQEEPSWAPPLLPPHEDDSCRAQGREPHAFSKQVANESHLRSLCQGVAAVHLAASVAGREARAAGTKQGLSIIDRRTFLCRSYEWRWISRGTWVRGASRPTSSPAEGAHVVHASFGVGRQSTASTVCHQQGYVPLCSDTRWCTCGGF